MRAIKGFALFLFGEKMKSIDIICPECGNIVYRYDGKSESKVTVKCHTCRKFYKFNPSNLRLSEIDDSSMRTTSSGMRFY